MFDWDANNLREVRAHHRIKPEEVEEALARTPERTRSERHPGELLAIGRECAALPDCDPRSADEILGYDENGVPRCAIV